MPWIKWSVRSATLCLLASVSPAPRRANRHSLSLNCSSFGRAVTVLPNGNIVVVDPFGFANKGAAYLYSPTGTLISTLTGSGGGDEIGMGGVVVLANVQLRSCKLFLE